MKVTVLHDKPFGAEIDMGKPDFSFERLGVSAGDAERLPNVARAETAGVSSGLNRSDCRGTAGIACAGTDESAFRGLAQLVRDAKGDFLRRQVMAAERTVTVSSVFTGTVHTVVWADEEGFVADDSDGGEGEEALFFAQRLSEHPIYREKTNVNMARVIDEKTVRITTWERGAGLTAACGTGACAVAVIGVLDGRLNRDTEVVLPGGALRIRIAEDGTIFMSGPAVFIAKGMYRSDRI
jgi:hypothetical protein